MAKLVSSGEDIGYTIIPYYLTLPLKAFYTNQSDHLLGFVTYNQETGERNFTYTESGSLTEAKSHWSLSILNEFPNCEEECSWLLYNCSPEMAESGFNRVLDSGETLHINNWDIWSTKAKKAKVAVVTSFQIY